MKRFAAARKYRRRFFVQALEDRAVPANFTVNGLTDTGAGSGTTGDLRYCLNQLANSTDPSNAIDATGVSGTITLTSTLPAISKPVAITGPGSGSLTVSGNNAVRVFDVSNGAGALAVSMTGLTVTAGAQTTGGGGGTTGDGAGIRIGDDILTLRDVVVSNCTTPAEGGGIGVGTAGTVILDSCTITGNSGKTGGGIYFAYNGRFDIQNSTISNNSAPGSGGPGGGAIYFYGNALGGDCVVRNSTISGNSADAGNTSGGGGICMYHFSGTLDIESSTITNNSTITGGGGGGLSAQYNFTTSATINIRNSIIAGNSTAASVYPDIFTDATNAVISTNSAYGANPIGNGSSNFAGTNDLYGASLNLQPLANNGGAVQTVALGAGSAAIDAGFNAGPNGTDGRGPTYRRKVGSAVDMGAFEFGSAPGIPTGSLANFTLKNAGGAAQTFTVLWADDGSINTGSLGNNDVRVTGPGGYNQLASLVSTSGSGGRISATYSMPAGTLGNATKWDANDSGVYTISVEPGSVLDNAANAVTADAIATLTVNIPFPTAKATAPNVQSAQLGTTSETITVTYNHQVPISFATLGNGDINVVGPNQGYNQAATFISATPGSDSTTIVATYKITAPGGTWDQADLGSYSITMNSGQVTDTDGIAVPAGQIGTFSVAVPLTIQVNTATNDESIDSDGKMSLREAILKANANVADAPDTITFSPSVFSGANTIALNQGEIVISDAVSIVGPGVNLLTVQASGSRHFNVNDPSTNGTNSEKINISGMRLTGGSPATGGGGSIALTSTDEVVSLTDMIFDSNTGAGYGGAIFEPAVAGNTVLTTLNLTRCQFLNNNAGGGSWGGAVYLDTELVVGATTNGNHLTITDCTFDNNLSNGNAGAVGMRFPGSTVGGSLSISGTTFSNNHAGPDTGGGAFGGGMSLLSAGGPGSFVTIRNSTFSNNHALDSVSGQGGAIQMGNGFNVTGGVTVQNCTFAFNQSYNGGAFARTSGGAVINFESTIVYNNTNTNGGIDFNGGVFTAKNSIIFSTSGSSGFTDLGGNQFGAAADPLLQPLANNGGLTKTHLPGPSSPAREAGSNPAGLATDQRGAGFSRTLGSRTDIGAVESVDQIPIAQLSHPDVTTSGANSDTFTVTYSDDTGINVSSLNTGDVTVSGPNGFSATPTFLGVNDNTNGTPRIATYGFTPPGGTWDKTDDGIYTVSVASSQVTDINSNSVKAGSIGTFRVAVPDTFVVTNLNDSGAGSLRDAVNQANLLGPSADSITFQAGLTGTITLTSGELLVTDSVSIVGPGASKLSVSGGGNSRILNLGGAGALTVNVSDLTVTQGGATGDGGAFTNANDVLNLTRVTATNNNASGNGGVFYAQSPSAAFNATDCIFTGNSAGQGGVVASLSNSNTTFTRCKIDGNSAATGGGVMRFDSGVVLVDSCQVTNNTAGTEGGAVNVTNVIGSMTFRNSTFSGNSAAVTGGAFGLEQDTRLLISGCTITNNTAGGGTGQGAAIFGNTNAIPPSLLGIETSIIVSNNGAQDIFWGFATVDITNSAIGTTGGVTPQDKGGNFFGETAASLNLQALANNGGPTLTQALVAGSKAIDAGSNPQGLAFDQRGTGFSRTSGKGTDMGAFEFQVATPPPTVTAVQVNDGSAQRSMVTSFKVTFSEALSFPSGVTAAFQLNRIANPSGGPSASAPLGQVNINAVQSGASVTITFASGGAVPIDPAGSLIDGTYQLVIVASKAVGTGGALDGDGNGTGGDNYSTPGTGQAGRLYRLFGDGNGSTTVDVIDFGSFRQAFGTSGPSPFDYDGSGSVDVLDFGQFRGRFGANVP